MAQYVNNAFIPGAKSLKEGGVDYPSLFRFIQVNKPDWLAKCARRFVALASSELPVGQTRRHLPARPVQAFGSSLFI